MLAGARRVRGLVFGREWFYSSCQHGLEVCGDSGFQMPSLESDAVSGINWGVYGDTAVVETPWREVVDWEGSSGQTAFRTREQP